MNPLLKTIRAPLASIGRSVFYRPFGLKRIGQFSGIRLPRRISGAKHIEIGSLVYIRGHSTIWAVSHHERDFYDPSIIIDDDVYIGRYVYIGAINHIRIGRGSVLSEHVYITDLSHGFEPSGGPIMKQRLVSKGPVSIGARCFIGYRAAIMPDVILGDHCVVGANAVVTHSFPPYSMIAGAPARLLKRYCFQSMGWRAVTESEQVSAR